MDVSSFSFYHCDLGPENVIADPAQDRFETNLLGDGWLCLPKACIRTGFGLCAELDLEFAAETRQYDGLSHLADDTLIR